MRPAAAALAAALLIGVASAQTPPVSPASPSGVKPSDFPCQPAGSDRNWIAAAPDAWTTTERDFLKLAPPAKPTLIVLFDAACTYRGTDGASWIAAYHHGDIETPRGDHEKPVNISYSAMANGEPFMLMALPSVWAAIMHKDNPDAFLLAVFVHEMTHTRQTPGFRARQRAVSAALKQGFDSDMVQARFGKDEAFAAAIAKERVVLLAGLAGDNKALRASAKAALKLMRERRAKWMVGEAAPYADAEDIAFTLEGAANLAAMWWRMQPDGGGLKRDAAFKEIDDPGNWSHGEGFLIMEAVGRLLPDWRVRAFGATPETALKMLAAAAGE